MFRKNPLYKEIILPEGLTTICTDAFAYSEIEKITIPSSVTKIEPGAFHNCLNLKEVTFLTNNLTLIPANLFINCSQLKKVILPNNIKYIEEWAFANCEALCDIKLPQTIERLGSQTFLRCKKLEALNLKDLPNLRDFGRGCFAYSGLVDEKLPDDIRILPPSVFEGCKKLTNLVLPKNLIRLEASSLSHCTSLTHIDLPDKLKEIANKVFVGTPLDYLVLPNTIEWIGGQAFKELHHKNADFLIIAPKSLLNNPDIVESAAITDITFEPSLEDLIKRNVLMKAANNILLNLEEEER